MPSWGEVLAEFHRSELERGGQPDADGIRRRYLANLAALTGRPVVIYYTDWLRGGSPQSGIDLGDMQGMMEVLQGLPGADIDVLLHSPGGSAEATASIVHYLRSKFSNVRVFVPLAAMSAATMWALSADVIGMGKHSQLGPIDPQIQMGQMLVGVGAIRDQFERAKTEISASPGALGAWAPILQQYGPGLLELCEQAEDLAKSLVQSWLAQYMFKWRDDKGSKARAVAEYFGDYRLHQSHGRGIFQDAVHEQGLNLVDLETDQALQDAVLSVHHAALLTLGAPVVKLIENNLGRAFVVQQSVMQVSLPLPGPMMPGPPIPGGAGPAPDAPEPGPELGSPPAP